MNTGFFEALFNKFFTDNSDVGSVRPLLGGDIHDVFRFTSDGKRYAIKVNRGMPSDVFEKEAKGLQALEGVTGLHVPHLVRVGEVNGQAFLMMNFIETGRKSIPATFGTELAELHRQSNDQFGWEEDNYLGSLTQRNDLTNNWAEFFTLYRIQERVKSLRDSGEINASDAKVFDQLEAKLEGVMPHESPSLLHGDLWSGNTLVDTDGSAYILDPAVYYGHREIDLAMMRLFGGFGDEVFESYHEAFPLEEGHHERVALFQLYPILTHAVLFGGSYTDKSVRIAKRYV